MAESVKINEHTIKHLEIIQDVITRMGSNSFQIKSWAIMTMSALLALFASNSNELFIAVAVVPTVIFWIIDTLYLQQERKFVCLYDKVAKGDPLILPLTMPLHLCNNANTKYWKCFFSKTLGWFYGAISVLLIVAFICLYCNWITLPKIS